jgi:hypothetical protein
MIVMCWTFLDYVDDKGSNQIEAWLESLAVGARKPVRAKLAAILIFASAQQWLQPPHFEALQGMRMFKVRFKLNNVQYRILASYGPSRREVTLLAGAVEKNDQYRPPNVFDTADRRRAEVLSDRKRVTPTCLLQKSN